MAANAGGREKVSLVGISRQFAAAQQFGRFSERSGHEEWLALREGSEYAGADIEIVGGLRPPAPYAFSRPSSANLLRGFLCNVVLSISPRRENASLRVSISRKLRNC